ncbi:hypothetical protein CKF94_24135 [Vibrio coralliilyticus]|uniref:hypothetical protein n=1 Tax=Vibrio coralliilyticus TaxID=190893 RepID=UPI000BAAA093|nr:hypothetical protein [Vibrio coralliilyticus]PAU35734.1 hypothetical protein CKF94_24135 [Vibrio coralliilyticus]
MLGFWVINLIVPGDPEEASITSPAGQWLFQKSSEYIKCKEAISNNQCAHTYSIEIATSMDDGAAACDRTLDEMTPILLGASFLSGLAVTSKASLPHSDISIIQATSHWPRERSMGSGNACVNNSNEFFEALEKFLVAWPTTGQSEKVLILIHHWLDALGCWSFEDLFLSATTLLQIISATEERITGNSNLSYLQAVQSASARARITPLNRDFKDMRNNLIHEGQLLGGRFVGTDIDACASVAADLMNWFDEYIHSVMNLGSLKRKRYSKYDFISLNSYSI